MQKQVAGEGGRPATGTVEWKRGQWWARVTLADGKRPLVALDPSIPREDEARARACAAVVSAEARAIGGVSALVRETIAEFTTRWLPYRRERGISSVDDDKGRLREWVLPIIGALDVRRVGREEAVGVVR